MSGLHCKRLAAAGFEVAFSFNFSTAMLEAGEGTVPGNDLLIVHGRTETTTGPFVGRPVRAIRELQVQALVPVERK